MNLDTVQRIAIKKLAGKESLLFEDELKRKTKQKSLERRRVTKNVMEIYGVVEGMDGEEAGACQGHTQ